MISYTRGVKMSVVDGILSTMRTKRFALEVLSMVEDVAGHHFYSLEKVIINR